MAITKSQWFVGVSRLPAEMKGSDRRKRDPATDTEVRTVLSAMGCRDIEPLGSGTANARIPDDWAKRAKAAGSHQLEYGRYCIDIDLP